MNTDGRPEKQAVQVGALVAGSAAACGARPVQECSEKQPARRATRGASLVPADAGASASSPQPPVRETRRQARERRRRHRTRTRSPGNLGTKPLRMLRAYPVTKMGDEGNAVMVPIDDIVYVFRGDRVDRKDVLVSWPSVIRQALRKDAIYLRTSKMLYRLAKHTSMRNLIDWFAFRGVRMEEAVGGSVLFNIEVPFVTLAVGRPIEASAQLLYIADCKRLSPLPARKLRTDSWDEPAE